MRFVFISCAVLGSGLALVAQTNLQSTPTEAPALVGPATNGPTIIHAHYCELHLRSNVGIYRENVRVDNPQMKLTCESLVVEAPKLDLGKYYRAVAQTNVVIDWTDDKGRNHATAEQAVYTYSVTNLAVPPAIQWQTNSLVVLTGNPVVTNSQQRFQGDPIVWDRIAGTVTSPNFGQETIYQTGTNANSFFDTTAPKPRPPQTPK